MKFGSRIHYLFVSFSKFAINNRKRINKAFGALLAILALVSALPLFSDHWRDIFLAYWGKFVNGLPSFIAYFYQPRAFIIYIVVLFLWMRLIYYKYEVRFLELALKNKRELAIELPKIKQTLPNDHYLGLILGKLNDTALEVKDRKGSDIISAIDKNIKKHEKVYWMSEDEIGIIFYEINAKTENDFITYVVKNKLKTEIGDQDASLFLNNITFVMVKIETTLELDTIESKARTKLLRAQASTAQAATGTPVKK